MKQETLIRSTLICLRSVYAHKLLITLANKPKLDCRLKSFWIFSILIHKYVNIQILDIQYNKYIMVSFISLYQHVSIEAMQLHMISQPVKSLM